MLKSAGSPQDNASQTYSNPTFTGTVTAPQVSGIEIVLAKWGVPVILGSSGTMGNNGAVSGMTALPKTYSGGAWMYFLANVITGSNAAGFYWFVGSSTTAGTVYNSTWDGTGIPTLGTTTAFVSTGPGAYAGVATGEITAATITIPANALGPNGWLKGVFSVTNNTAAGNKIFRLRYSGGAGTQIINETVSTNATGYVAWEMMNTGVAGQQMHLARRGNATAMGMIGNVYTSVDSTASATAVLTLEKATATNHIIWDAGLVTVAYGA